jgi:hypothetical protein
MADNEQAPCSDKDSLFYRDVLNFTVKTKHRVYDLLNNEDWTDKDVEDIFYDLILAINYYYEHSKRESSNSVIE